MKRLVTLLSLCCLFAVNAFAETVDGINYSFDSTNNTATVTYLPNNEKYQGDIVIPANVTYDGVSYSVTSIGDGAFWGCTGLTSITIPDGVTSIDFNAFYNCTGLTSITIPDGVTSIGSDAFRGCTSLPVENGVRYADNFLVGVIDETLSTYTIREGTKWIGSSAFSGCALTNITIPEGVTSIGSYAFYGCSGLTSITIPDGVTSIGRWAFADCTNLTSITIPNSVTIIDIVAFYGCTGLTSITIPDGVTTICSGAFEDCTGLTSITIPEGVTIIGDYAFAGCTNLTSITIPNSVTIIGDEAFHNCTSLPAEDGIIYVRNYLVGVTDKTLSSYSIKEGTKSIGSDAFYGCTGLTSITIPEGVTYIGWDAFRGCTGLTSITIPEGVTYIGYGAFYDCTRLSSITIPIFVLNKVNYYFKNTYAITELTLLEGETSIPDNACAPSVWWEDISRHEEHFFSNLTSITIPSSVSSIGDNAFKNCEKIEDVFCYAETVPTAGNNTFELATRYFATLHVPESAIEDYKNTYPWKQFGKIVAIGQENEEPDVKQDTIYVTVHDTIYISNPGEIAVPTIMIQGNMAIIMCSDQDAYVLYTTDGSEPEPGNAQVYSMPFTLTESCTIKAVAVRKSVSASSEYVPTGVRRSEMVSSQYYISPTGVQSLNPSKGINVVVTEYEDGTTSVSKEYVK